MKKIVSRILDKLIGQGMWRRLLSKRSFWTVSGLSFVAAFAIGFPLVSTSTPKFCGSCHIMKKYYQNWETSTHANVGCATCHVKPGLINAIHHKTQVWKEPYMAWIVKVKEVKPEEVEIPENESCLLCHTEDREISPSGDLKIPHRKHLELDMPEAEKAKEESHLLEPEKLKCAYCHYRMVHTETPRGLNTPPMERCFTCHDGKKASKACNACHTKMSAPKDHRRDWTLLHGEKARKDRKYCDQCHAVFPKFCSDCHSTRPESHEASWWKDHEDGAKSRPKGCKVCHGKNFCAMCHKLVHPADWVKDHPSGGAKKKSFCVTCHNNPGFCTDCHAKRGVK